MRKAKNVIRTQENYEYVDEQHDISEIYNVRDFGVKGDGTDETRKIKNLLNLFPNLFFPEGDYKISEPLDGRGHGIRGTNKTYLYFQKTQKYYFLQRQCRE